MPDIIKYFKRFDTLSNYVTFKAKFWVKENS